MFWFGLFCCLALLARVGVGDVVHLGGCTMRDLLMTSSAHGQRTASARSAHGQHMASTWAAHGQCMVSTWPAHGQHMPSTWPAHGQHMVSTRPARAYMATGETRPGAWSAHGRRMVGVWSACGRHAPHGLLLKHLEPVVRRRVVARPQRVLWHAVALAPHAEAIVLPVADPQPVQPLALRRAREAWGEGGGDAVDGQHQASTRSALSQRTVSARSAHGQR